MGFGIYQLMSLNHCLGVQPSPKSNHRAVIGACNVPVPSRLDLPPRNNLERVPDQYDEPLTTAPNVTPTSLVVLDLKTRAVLVDDAEQNLGFRV